MADSDTVTPEISRDIAPWGPRSGEPPAAAVPIEIAPVAGQSRLNSFIWGALSTVVLAIWIALWAGPLGALALVGGVFVHEFGHVLVINWAGAGPSSIRIIPFFGGAATMRRAPDSDFKGVLIALSGPCFGLLFALPFIAAAELTGQRSWWLGAFFVGAMNLINLVPAAPLDGSKALGPVLWRIHPWLERAVMLLLAALVLDWSIQTNNWLFGGVVALGAVRAFLLTGRRFVTRPLNLAEGVMSVILYLLSVGLCAGVTFWALRSGGLQPQSLLFGGQS